MSLLSHAKKPRFCFVVRESITTIATVKAALVVVIFMEMRFGQPLTWFAGTTGVAFLLLLIGLTMADVMSRGWLGVPGK
jgi:caa(3)-type oxidase subunit IV